MKEDDEGVGRSGSSMMSEDDGDENGPSGPRDFFSAEVGRPSVVLLFTRLPYWLV